MKKTGKPFKIGCPCLNEEDELRRSDKEITNRSEIDDILGRASICHLGLNAGGECYVVPVNFGYDGACLYIHSAKEGGKSTSCGLIRGSVLLSMPTSVCRSRIKPAALP